MLRADAMSSMPPQPISAAFVPMRVRISATRWSASSRSGRPLSPHGLPLRSMVARVFVAMMPAAPFEGDRVGPVVVEAHAVEDRAICGTAEHAGRSVAFLRKWRDGAEFDEAEAERPPRERGDRVFIHPRRQTDAIRERQPGDCHRGDSRRNEPVQPSCECRPRSELGGGTQREIVRVFGIELKQQRPCKAIQHNATEFSSFSRAA